jgi:hypothetical protein
LWKGLNGYFNPTTNCQVFAPLWSEDAVTTTQAIVVGTKEVSQTLSEGTIQTTQFSSLNTKDLKWVHIEKKLKLRTPLQIVPTLELLNGLRKKDG